MELAIAHTDGIASNFNPENPMEYLIDQLVEADDIDLLCPIRYVYDYLPQNIEWLKPQPVTLPSSFCSASGKRRKPEPQSTVLNAIQLSVSKTSLPVHTGLTQFGQTRYWKASIQAARSLLEFFATDERSADMTIGNGRSLAGQAADQLAILPNTYSRFSMYMFPNGDERRTQLIAEMVVLIFVFDGKSPVYLRFHYVRFKGRHRFWS